MTDPQDLAALVAQATPGPWTDEILTHTDPNGDDYPCDVEVSNGAGRHIHGHDLGYDGDVDLEILANARLIAMAPDLARTVLEQQAEIARLTAELAEAREHIRHVSRMGEGFADMQQRAENAEAALSEIQAMLAMAFEVAAGIQWVSSSRGLIQMFPEMADTIRALTPADAQAALDARINAAKEEGRVMGLREAAEITGNTRTCLLPNGQFLSEQCRDAILAKIKEADHD